MQTVIRMHEVSKTFRSTGEDVHALRSVSLEVSGGEYVCIYGASGSGKSTLLNVIAGLEVPDEGVVEILGTATRGMSLGELASMRLRNIGVIFQDDNLISELTAAENIELVLEALGRSGAEARAEALQALDKVDIADLADRMPPEMSGGQRQRVGVARALTADHAIILADEPTGSLDSVTSAQLFELLQHLADTGVTIVVVTHDPLATNYASRVLDMRDGVISSVSESEASSRLARLGVRGAGGGAVVG